MPKVIVSISILMMLFFTFSLYNPARAQIAPGVQQSAAQTAAVTGTVTESNGTPVVGADVRLIGPAVLTTKSDARGIFDFTSVPYGIYRIDVTVANLGTASHTAITIKGDITVAIQYAAQNNSGLKEIARVSTHSSGAQINVTPASIASVNPSDFAFQGNTSWKELFNQIPGVTAGGGINHGNLVSVTIPDSPLQPITLSINGALPYETSVTLDGMPLNNSSFSAASGNGVDLALLPMPAFTTGDVVRGPGANAPSIVDSIGGSFVLHAPGRVDKNQFEFSVSNDPYGGIATDAKVALRFGKLSATIIYGMNNSPGPLGDQKVIAFNAASSVGTINGQTFQGCGSPPSPYSCFNASLLPSFQNCYCELSSDLLIGGTPTSTKWGAHSGTAGLSYDVTPSITAQVFYAGSYSEMPVTSYSEPVNFMPGPGYIGGLSAGTYNFINIPGGYSATEASSLLEERVTAYVQRGVLRLAAMQNNTFSTYTSINSYPDGYYTLYGTGNVGATYPGSTVNYNGTTEYLTFPLSAFFQGVWTNARDLLASYVAQVGLKSSVGLSYVSSYYNYPYWYSGSCCGGFSYSGNFPSAVSETTRELRISADSQISEKLSIAASWYFARGMYHVQNPADSSGNTYTDSTFPYNAPRLGATWRASRDIVIRAAAGGGYALPSLLCLVGQNIPSFQGTYYSVSQPNLNLRPEASFGFDLGTDIRFHRDTVLSLDLYRTNLYGQFFQSTNLNGLYNGLPLYVTQFNNLAKSRMEGINLDIRHDVPKGMYWHSALGLTRAYVMSVPPGFYDPTTPGGAPQNTYVVPGINFNGYFGSAVPYATGTAQLGYRWSLQKFIDLSPTYYGNNNAYFQPAFLEFDAHASYGLTKDVSLFATFRNITNIHGANFQQLNLPLGAPAVNGDAPFALFALPYGPRSVIVTLNFKK